MISKALNLSDRLSGCAKLAKRMLSGQKTRFCVYQFLTAMEGASPEELDEFLVRFNMNGIEADEEASKNCPKRFRSIPSKRSWKCHGAKKLSRCITAKFPWENPWELLVLRKSLARELLPDGKIGAASTHPYYEVASTSPKLYDLVAALIRTKAAAATIETVRA